MSDERETCPDCDGSDMGERCRKCRASVFTKISVEDALRAEIEELKCDVLNAKDKAEHFRLHALPKMESLNLANRNIGERNEIISDLKQQLAQAKAEIERLKGGISAALEPHQFISLYTCLDYLSELIGAGRYGDSSE